MDWRDYNDRCKFGNDAIQSVQSVLTDLLQTSWFVKRASGSTRDSFSSFHCIIRISLSKAKDWQVQIEINWLSWSAGKWSFLWREEKTRFPKSSSPPPPCCTRPRLGRTTAPHWKQSATSRYSRGQDPRQYRVSSFYGTFTVPSLSQL